MKRKGPRIIIIVLVTVAILATMILTALPGSTRTVIADYFGRIFDPLTSFFQTSVASVGDFFTAVSENKELKHDIAELEKENARLRQEVRTNEEKVKAYDELEEALNLKSRFEDYEIIGGIVINRSIGPMFDLFRINLGREDGIWVTSDRSYPVLDSQHNMVGRLYSSELGSSRVVPLLHEGFSVSSKVPGSAGSNFRVRGSVEYKDQGLCLADQILEGTPLRVGDQVVSTGDGGLYPEGIAIGTVVDIFTDSQSNALQALIEPYSKLEELNYVFVLVDHALSSIAEE
ncbi:MAG: rod shape-determining protein MreC [Eubacteriales bacterium]|nr:rod shape-determining protein MreC [Eubacteriales bacterium]MDD4324285.1 rod shape-determining protein MreC [Eubacteriales bacterium]MDD4541992.1 rod shape-determining protein MreC [Eubacteriales bacterium]